jgi:hypothetical protein
MTEIPTLDERLNALAGRLRSDLEGESTDRDADRNLSEAAAALEILASAGTAGPLVEPRPVSVRIRDVMCRELAEALGSPSSDERWEALLDSVEALASDTTISDRLAELAGALGSSVVPDGADWDELIAAVGDLLADLKNEKRSGRDLAAQAKLIVNEGKGWRSTLVDMLKALQTYAPGHDEMSTEELRAEVSAVLARTLKELHNERKVSAGLTEHVRSLNTALGVAAWAGVRTGERAAEALRERIAAAALLHTAGAGISCTCCEEPWPCPTRRVLDPAADEATDDVASESAAVGDVDDRMAGW